jgi:hypothetical protein
MRSSPEENVSESLARRCEESVERERREAGSSRLEAGRWRRGEVRRGGYNAAEAT